jgi:LAO/AO transport system kinase
MHHGKLETIAGANNDPDTSESTWVPPILRTVAIEGQGIPELVDVITAHRAHLKRTGGWEQRERWRLQTELDILLQNRLMDGFRSRLSPGAIEQALAAVQSRKISPFQAVEKLMSSIG